MELELANIHKSWLNSRVNALRIDSTLTLSSNPTAGYVLTCDAKGVGTWQIPGGSLPETMPTLTLTAGANQLIFTHGGNFCTIDSEPPSQNTYIILPDPGKSSSNFVLTDSGSGQTLNGGYIFTAPTANQPMIQFDGASNQLLFQSNGPGTGITLNVPLSPGTFSTITLPDPQTTSASIILSNTVAGQTITGGLQINNGGSSSTGICTGSFSGVLDIGNSGMNSTSTLYIGNLNGLSTLNINASGGVVNMATAGSSAVNIGTGTYSGQIMLGNSSATLKIGATSITPNIADSTSLGTTSLPFSQLWTDGGNLHTDGTGNLTITGEYKGDQISLNGGAFSVTSTGNLTTSGTLSCDGTAITSNGSGTLTTSHLVSTDITLDTALITGSFTSAWTLTIPNPGQNTSFIMGASATSQTILGAAPNVLNLATSTSAYVGLTFEVNTSTNLGKIGFSNTVGLGFYVQNGAGNAVLHQLHDGTSEKSLATFNNTLDDGSGNMAIAGTTLAPTTKNTTSLGTNSIPFASLYLNTLNGTPAALTYYEEVQLAGNWTGPFLSKSETISVNRIGRMVIIYVPGVIVNGNSTASLATFSVTIPSRFLPFSSVGALATLIDGFSNGSVATLVCHLTLVTSQLTIGLAPGMTNFPSTSSQISWTGFSIAYNADPSV